MFLYNKILIQLNHAIRFSNSEFPQEKEISVILFDNLIEIILYQKTENLFLKDSTSWFAGSRKYSLSIRQETHSYYNKLIGFAVKEKLLTDKESELLKYAHRIRNEIYHKSISDELTTQSAFLVYYNILRIKLPDWGHPWGLIGYMDLPGYRQIDFGQGLSNKDPIFDKEYYRNAYEFLMNKLAFKNDLPIVVKKILIEQLDRIIWNIDFIKKSLKEINFYDVLGRYWYLNNDFVKFTKEQRKPKNLDSILLIYLFIREHKEELDDLNDLIKRQKRGRYLLRKTRKGKNKRYPYWIDISRMQERVRNIPDSDEHKIIKITMDIQDKIANIYSDINNAASDLDAHIQHLIDVYKGK
jgi:hypothetical protein